MVKRFIGSFSKIKAYHVFRFFFQSVNQPDIIFLLFDITAQFIDFISFDLADNWFGNIRAMKTILLNNVVVDIFNRFDLIFFDLRHYKIKKQPEGYFNFYAILI